MKLNEILKMRSVIGALYKEKIPVKLAYKFMKLLKDTNDDESFFNEKMGAIIEQYGKKDENGQYAYTENGGVKIQEDKFQECLDSTNELNETDVDAPKVTFTIDELGELKLSIEDMEALNSLIRDEEQK